MESAQLLHETITPLSDRHETAPMTVNLGLGAANWGQIGQGNWANAGGNQCFAGCPTIIVQLNIATIVQILMVNATVGAHHH